MVRNNKIFYGWFIVAACFALASGMGETFFAFGVFFKPLESEFGWSRSVVSSAYTASIVGYSISAVVSGGLVDRYSPRITLLVSAILTGAGTALSGQVANIDQLRLYQFIAGLGAGACFTIPNYVVQQWFHGRKDAGTALALVICGTGAGQLVFPPVINVLILSYGWRNAYLISGVFFGLICLACTAVIKKRLSDGDKASSGVHDKSNSKNAGWLADLKKTMLTRTYGGMFFVACTGILSWQVISVHLVPYAIDVGVPALIAATALGLLGGMTIPGRLAIGFISNRIGWQKSLSLALYGMATSAIFLLFLRNTPMLYVFVVWYGIFWGIRAVAQWGLLGEFFGLRSLGILIGITGGISTLIGGFGPYFAGFIVDTTGSYSIAFMTVAALMIGGGFIVTLLKRPSDRP